MTNNLENVFVLFYCKYIEALRATLAADENVA
jgi:hypothetical protein